MDHDKTVGRKGKGVLYVFSAGNGRVRGDNCAADGYLNRIDTIAIACVRADGEPPLYSEACNAVMATAYSGGNTDPIKIITTDIFGTCTCEHTGTSAASPFVAGVLALALEANPGLTWRDAQHLLAWSCDVAPVSHSAGWERNARKLWYHPAYGFGLINAFKLVSLAKGWTNVPPQAKCEIPVDVGTVTDFSKASSWKQSVNVTACSGTADEVKFQDCRSSNTSTRIDFNVVPVYQELNITGRGVNIIVLDDGIDYGHEDLAASFSPDLSYNFNNDTNDCRPRSSDSRNKHGTRCAGQLVMKPNNSKCGVGICYGAKVG
ncbi:neuroendocrine convertase 1-like, partial [Diaphorina citri]|uniref:Neuroendocrine convertase 1-like n=1 Tax=Diaphorina citri TaxID=121845 RepID=A0A1S3DP12_DIACI